MKKLVVRLDIHDDKAKQKALKTVSTFQGIDFIAVDMKERTLTVIGTVDPVNVVSKLRKYWQTDIITVGPAKEPEKKEAAAAEAKKEGGGGEQQQQDDPSKKSEEHNNKAGDHTDKKNNDDGSEKLGEEAGNKKGSEGDHAKKVETIDQEKMIRIIDPAALELVRAYRAYNPQLTNSYYYAHSIEENPNACSIS